VTGSNHSHRSRTHGVGAAGQIDVRELQGQQVGGKPTFHHWFERLSHLPGLGVRLLHRHNGAGDGPTAASAMGGAAHATEQQRYCTTCIKRESHIYTYYGSALSMIPVNNSASGRYAGTAGDRSHPDSFATHWPV
jgi:hypothetical protein